jgi:hypothetical protein
MRNQMLFKLDKSIVSKLIQELNLENTRDISIYNFLKTVHYCRLRPYINLIKEFPDIESEFKNLIPDCKDKWDIIVYLYRYNIKLSMAIYPYIYLLENVLKTQITYELCDKLGENWYIDENFLTNLNDKTRAYFVKFKYKYLKTTQTPDLEDFIENHTVFGYWITLLEINNLWDSKNIKLKKLFVNSSIIDLISVPTREIYTKLKSINDLRNNIAHHNQIIRKKISTRTKHDCYLGDIYQNILYILSHLGCNNIDWMIGDLHCKPEKHCKGNSFEILYKNLEFIHNYEIGALNLHYNKRLTK